jgi:monofunctional glycosyltransferase
MTGKTSRLKRLVFLFSIAVFLFISFNFLYPDLSELKEKNPEKTAMMAYREREWKRDGKNYRINQKWVPLKAVSPFVVKGVLIAEDDKFWSHEGFDYKAIRKAIEKDIREKKFKAGGSTISQQVAKNLYLSPSKTPLRKIREAIITWRMEKVLSKKRILEIYLNIAEWGDRGVFGIEAASKTYYGKSASQLSPDEAARLVSVLPNPRKFNPLRNSKYVVNRSNLIYGIMVRRGIVVPEFEEVAEVSSAETDPNGLVAEPVLTEPALIEEVMPSEPQADETDL